MRIQITSSNVNDRFDLSILNDEGETKAVLKRDTESDAWVLRLSGMPGKFATRIAQGRVEWTVALQRAMDMLTDDSQSTINVVPTNHSDEDSESYVQ